MEVMIQKEQNESLGMRSVPKTRRRQRHLRLRRLHHHIWILRICMCPPPPLRGIVVLSCGARISCEPPVPVACLARSTCLFRICGGVGGDPHKPEIRIHSIQAGSVASGLNLEAGDIIVHINHRKLDDVTVQAASKLLQKAYGLVAMGVSRKVADQRPSVQLDTLPFADDGCTCTALL